MTEKAKKNIYTVFFMTLITVIFITALAYTHLKTRDRIKANAENFKKAAILSAAGVSFEKNSVADVYDMYIRETVSKKDSKKTYYVVLDETKTVNRYVFVTEGPGLWGVIIAAVGVEKDFKTLTGISFIKQDETPGLGARIEEPWFKAQFKGKIPPLVRVNEGEPTTVNQFDAITGATATSKAVQDIVNNFVMQEITTIVQEAGDSK